MEWVPVIAGRPYYRWYEENNKGEKRRQNKDSSLVEFLNQLIKNNIFKVRSHLLLGAGVNQQPPMHQLRMSLFNLFCE
jgi:hypothetical protein